MAKKPSLILSGSMQRNLATPKQSVVLKSLSEQETERQAAKDAEAQDARESVAKSEGVVIAGPGMAEPIEERSPASFVEDMLKRGRTPKDILAVARNIRGGQWYPKVKVILEAKGILPPPEPKEPKVKKAKAAPPEEKVDLADDAGAILGHGEHGEGESRDEKGLHPAG